MNYRNPYSEEDFLVYMEHREEQMSNLKSGIMESYREKECYKSYENLKIFTEIMDIKICIIRKENLL